MPHIRCYGQVSEPFAKRMRLGAEEDDGGEAMAIMQLHRRVVAIEASLGGQLRSQQCLSEGCQRWAAPGYETCCRFCSNDTPGHHSRRCPPTRFVDEIGQP